MDDKTLVEHHFGTRTYWALQLDLAPAFSYYGDFSELYSDLTEVNSAPIAFPRTLKAARQILKEAGWTILKNGEHS